ncbi:MAG: L-glutamate gamma-semialdehyde dehydrogenase, partial [bacterium]
AFESWRFMRAEERATYLFKAAHICRARKSELTAWQVYEVGKNWAEADADVAEAIDFLEYYGREMLRVATGSPLYPYPGEANEAFYIPLGPVVVIPPWNFPFAILVGMASAAIVTGNTVVLKPSSDSPMQGWLFHSIMKEAGLPDGVLNYVTGSGGTVGDPLVEDGRTRMVAFTGSREVGTRIYELGSKVQPGQIWLKRVIAEMGGKDAMVIDREADLEAAAAATVAAAFGFQGQKCSACSRLIVDEPVYDVMVERVVAKAKTLKVGPARDNHAVGPVINAGAEKKILDYIAIGKKEGRLVCGGKKAPGSGYFIEPTVFADIKPKARLAQEEIFGPVLSIIKARGFENAMEIANNTQYGLTGSFWSRNREKIANAKQVFHCGNLYINRKCTGALVGVHPFGGFNMSGTDSKAGGPDYLLLFMQAKAVSEKLT